MLKLRVALLLAMSSCATVCLPADETVGTPLPAPHLKALKAAALSVTVTDGQMTVGMQVKHAGRSSRIEWSVPPFQWVPLDANDRDPSFSEIRAFADSKVLPVQRISAAWWEKRDVTTELRALNIDPAQIALGDISELPNDGTTGLHKGDPAHAYFRDIDGTLFPAWETRVRAWASVPASTRVLSYTYRLRPSLFLIANRLEVAMKEIQAHCQVRPEMKDRLLASLQQGNLVCLYRAPLPTVTGAIAVEWRVLSQNSDEYICSASHDDITRMAHGATTLSANGLTELRGVVITKDDHCGQ